MTGLADTGFLVAFLNRRDHHHRWALDLARTVTAPLVTCEAVLAETAFQVQSATLTLGLVETGLIRVEFSVALHRARLQALAERYADRRPDLAGLCLICLSEAWPKLPVLTTDGDFATYRRHQREVIPVLMPPERRR